MFRTTKLLTRLQKILLFNKKTREDTGMFFIDKSHIDRLPFSITIKRLCAQQKRKELIIDPLLFMDLKWYLDNYEVEFKNIILTKYYPSKPLTLNMPKGNFTYRPVSYLWPIDSLVYQSLVDIMIKYKRNYFSKQVYSDILNDVNGRNIFDNPIKHWLRMRDNLRKQFINGNNAYFTVDISGFFENVKIKKLVSIIHFYVGRKEKFVINYLEKLLCEWQYAEAQGIIQPHPASSIIGKIYLALVDSDMESYGNKYNRYVDEFHLMLKTKRQVISATFKLNESLRNLGLNINSKKTIYLEGGKILDELNKEKDFFDMISYLEQRKITNISLEIIKGKFKKLIDEFKKDGYINLKVFRRCIHKFEQEQVSDVFYFV